MGRFVDLICVVQDASEMRSTADKRGEQCALRDIMVADES